MGSALTSSEARLKRVIGKKAATTFCGMNRDTSECIVTCDLWHLVWHAFELYSGLQYGCSKKPQPDSRGSFDAVRLSCKIALFRSGPDETRTRDLRHAKAAKQFLMRPNA